MSGGLSRIKERGLKLIRAALMGALLVAPASAMANTHVATIETDNPSGNTVISSTIPLPIGFLGGTLTTEPFGLVDGDGTIAQGQTDVVSRYADGSASIVQISTRIFSNASQGMTPGKYKVVHLSNPAPKKQAYLNVSRDLVNVNNVNPTVKNYFLHGERMTIRAKDIFGKTYSLRPFEAQNKRIHKVGYVMPTLGMFGQLTPDGGFNIANQRELPKIMDIALWATTRAYSPVISFQMLYGNNAVGAGKYIGKAYFKELSIDIPSTHSLVMDINSPSVDPVGVVSGNKRTFKIVKPRSDGTHYVLLPGSLNQVKFAIVPVGFEYMATDALNLRGVAFAQRDTIAGAQSFSWENPSTAAFDNGHPTANLNWLGKTTVRNKLATHESSFRTHMTTGAASAPAWNGKPNAPFLFGQLGDEMPYDFQYGGYTGGSNITPNIPVSIAYAASTKGLLFMMHKFDTSLDRNDRFWIHADGTPWRVDGNLQNCTGTNNPTGKAQTASFGIVNGLPLTSLFDQFAINSAGQFNYHRNAVVAQNAVPSYESTMLGYQPTDFQHFTRFAHTMYPLIELNNDPVAKYVAEAMAQNIRATYTIYAQGNNAACPVFNNQSSLLGHYLPTVANPGKGVGLGRENGDMFNSVAHGFKYGDDIIRAGLRPWLNMAADTVNNAIIACSGMLMKKSMPNGKALAAPYNTSNWLISQSISEQRINEAMHAIKLLVMKGFDSTRENALQSTIVLHDSRLIKAPYWNASNNTFPHFTLVSNSSTGQIYCPNDILPGMTGGSGTYEINNALLTGYKNTGNPAYLTAANGILYGNTVKFGLEHRMGKDYILSDPWSQRGLAIAQELNLP